jgi:hypothetical protein
MADQLSRTALYELVWREPRSTLAKRFSISDVGLSKICAAANIPQPPRGYWARLATGKYVSRPALPARALGQADLIRIGHAGYATPRDEDDAEAPAAPVFDESLDVLRARAAALLKKSRVPRNLQSPHPLVAAVLAEDNTRREAVARNPHAWPKPDFATPASMRRARIANALLIMLAHAGARASLRGKDLQQFSVRVGDVIVSLELGAVHARIRPFPMPRAQQQELLRLAVTGWQAIPGVVAEWLDSDRQPMEQRIIEIARDILVFGEMAYRAAAQREHAWRVECKHRRDAEARAQQERLARETAERHARYDEQRRQWLQRQTENWQKAIQIRALIDAMDQRHTVDDGVGYCHWRAWALAEADRLDPLLQPLTAVVEPPDCA